MADYYTPDSIWESFRVESQEDHVEKYVIKGNFHPGVHEDVVNSFQTAEYLMAHSYYHWQMYDQALVKFLSIFEMAVKLRSKELNNPLQFQDKKGRTFDKKLVRLIDELKEFGYPETLIKELHWLRKLRNNEAHTDRNSFGGALKKRPIVPGLNMINRLFIDPEKLKQQIAKNDLLLKEKNTFEDNVLIYSLNDKKILMHNLEFLEFLELEQGNCEYWKASPIVTDTFDSFSDMRFPNPFPFFLKEVKYENGDLIGKDFYTNQTVSLAKTDKQANVDAYKEHVDAIERLDGTSKFAFEKIERNHLNTQLEEFVYKHAWTSNLINN